MNLDTNDYASLVAQLRRIIPKTEFDKVLSQYYCEYALTPENSDDPGYLGFLKDYASLVERIPQHHTVIDLGCYLAPQSYFFKDHHAYIGVDICGIDEIACPIRFTPDNATHYELSIQEFVSEFPEYLGENMNVTAICNAVPDAHARKLVRKSFANHFMRYPEMTHEDLIPVNPLECA